MPTFAYTSSKKKKKSRSGRKIGAVGDDKQLSLANDFYNAPSCCRIYSI